MEINNWSRLISAKLVKKEIENPASDLIILGHYGGWSTYKQDAWSGYAMKITDLIEQFGYVTIQGATGPRGIQGIQGNSGAQGVKGDKGDPGDTFTLLGVVEGPSSLPADPNNLDAYLFATGDVVIYDPTGSGPPLPGYPGWINLGLISGPRGPQGIQGVKGDQGETGEDGGQGDAGIGIASVYYNSVTGELTLFFTEGDPYTTTSIKGDQGDEGDPGSVWRNGVGAPANSLGIDGDYYLNNTTGDVYKKEAGVYGITANIKGPTGTCDCGVYDLLSPTTQTVGGIPSGTNITGWTWQEIIQALLVPYASPVISQFYMTNTSNVQQATTLEAGASISGNKKFYIVYTQPANVQANTFKILGESTPILGPGAAVPTSATYTPVINISPAVVSNVIATYTWTGSFNNTLGTLISKTFQVGWSFRVYVGGATAATLDAAGIQGLTVYNNLKNNSSGSYVFPTYSPNRYLYFCFPDVSGFAQPLTITDSFGTVPMTADPPYTNVDGTGRNYAIVSVTNVNGITINYRVYRTVNNLTAGITVTIS
jgi:hypothetical protein